MQIGSTTYGFIDGALASNALIYHQSNVKSTTPGNVYYDYFYVNEDGVMTPNAGWVQLKGYWYYIGAEGSPLYGIQKIGSTQYSFRKADGTDGYPVGSLIEST